MKIIRSCLAVLAGLGGTLLALAAAAPAAFAGPRPDGGGCKPVVSSVHAVVASGMPGWQITLIAVVAALAGAATAVIVDRIWTARRHLGRPAA